MRLLPMRLRPAGVCPPCGRSLVFTGKRWQEPGKQAAHVCPPVRRTCGVWMRVAGERCARKPGHGYEHRTRYALDNAARRWAA